MDEPLVSAQYVPLFSLLGAPALPTIQTKLAGLPTAEGVVTGGLDAAQKLAASLQPHNGTSLLSHCPAVMVIVSSCVSGMLNHKEAHEAIFNMG